MSGRPLKKQVLLVEDEDILADLITQKLELAGMEVTRVADGDEGLTQARQQKYDIILLDILLPGKNGYEIMQALSDEGIVPALPVIIISNSGQDIQIKRLKALGVKDYIIKVNFDPGEVLAKVKEVLGVTGDTTPVQTPDSSSTTAVPAKEGEAAKAEGKRKNVLLVEDDPFLSKILLRKLEGHFNVYHAADAEQAEAIMNSHPLDMVCLDIILPGKDGFTFLGEMKQNKQLAEIPVLILSNLGQDEEIQRGMKEGAAGYLVKANSSPDEIVDHVIGLSNKKST